MNNLDFTKIFSRIQQGEKSLTLDREIDGILTEAQSSKKNLNCFTAAMSKSDMTQELIHLWDNTNLQRWDLASTGGVANITPIFGYLWLMVAAEQTKQNGQYTRVVPKISSDGKGGGTIDILASGGLTFTSDPVVIKRKCLEFGGVICQQDDALTPIDKALMVRRRETNLMTNIYLTYASILSKKMAMRCTHAIVDIKLGKDTKILASWMDSLDGVKVNDYLTAFENINTHNSQSIVISDHKCLQAFAQVLQELEVTVQFEQEGVDWIVQNCGNNNQELAPLKEVRWLLTNANIPQCRAIGRQLLLLHIDQLITDPKELLMRDGNNEYKKLYRQLLPKICDCQLENPDANWINLQKQWENLKFQLPKFETFFIQNYLTNNSLELEISHKLDLSFGQVVRDLEVISFGLYPYHLLTIKQNVTIKTMNIEFLDKLFTWLCGNEPYDPEVGIWLHKLPGEEVKQAEDSEVDGKRYLKICNKRLQPIISVFYRPSRCSQLDLIAKVRDFLCHIQVISHEN